MPSNTLASRTNVRDGGSLGEWIPLGPPIGLDSSLDDGNGMRAQRHTKPNLTSYAMVDVARSLPNAPTDAPSTSGWAWPNFLSLTRGACNRR